MVFLECICSHFNELDRIEVLGVGKFVFKEVVGEICILGENKSDRLGDKVPIFTKGVIELPYVEIGMDDILCL